ncbi:MAG: glycosyltransferase family 39 protein [Lachnospiraceae bacterium]|nr:glycosyltransferase family 39 protein [Lachnospiraceae bacterium]
MGQKYRWHKPDRETIVFLLFLTGMAVYYGWRMFALTPWYDELYTYYYFISRGPVYAAIHWPLPNNHMCYSMLSACLTIFGNSAVSLRGISYLSSIGSLVLLFRIGRKCFERGMALIPVFCFAGMKMVNQLAVQGRGYALVTFCYLAALNMLLCLISEGKDKVKYYVVFGISLVVALYAIPSSVYVVVPVCLVGGFILLMRGKYKRLWLLILTSLISAVFTVGIYSIVWLAIGSNLLVKSQDSAYYGMSHADVLMRAPFTALKTGIDYMLATPYIQSVSRAGYLRRLVDWLGYLLNEYYTGGKMILALLLIVCVTSAAVSIVLRIRESKVDSKQLAENQEDSCDDFISVYLVCSILCIPLMLIIQCALPYHRVFSFAGVVVAIAFAWFWQGVVRLLAKGSPLLGKGAVLMKPKRHIAAAGSLWCGIWCVVLLFTLSYNVQYSAREAAIEDAYRAVDVTQYSRIAVADCDQEYLLKYLYGLDMESENNVRLTTVIEDADCVLLDRDLLLPEGYFVTRDSVGDWWKFYVTKDTIPAEYLEEQMQAGYENNRFIFYIKNQ